MTQLTKRMQERLDAFLNECVCIPETELTRDCREVQEIIRQPYEQGVVYCISIAGGMAFIQETPAWDEDELSKKGYYEEDGEWFLCFDIEKE